MVVNKNLFVWSIVIFPTFAFMSGYWFVGVPLLFSMVYFMLNNKYFEFCLRSEKLFAPIAIAYNVLGLSMYISGFYFSNFKGVLIFLFVLNAMISLPMILRLDKRFEGEST